MPPEPTAADLLAVVAASPRAVAAHDRPAWVGLFAEGAVVNDPVGSTPHIGRVAIERFYDTFIAPNTITFDITHDFAGPATILRDLTIRITMPTGATVHVPMHLRYELVEVAGELRIETIRVHTETVPRRATGTAVPTAPGRPPDPPRPGSFTRASHPDQDGDPHAPSPLHEGTAPWYLLKLKVSVTWSRELPTRTRRHR
ncbi:nuclear transport factor 2 family protein [Nocardia brevicatena]|uniref:nuclear transport factor 2 family protein n=1 Tax=Nocardia brevicatena TaxID=37327 RepID=UPI00031ADCDD|nr:nuclear transport factor 2 family protein [Nocardia brevicatena]